MILIQLHTENKIIIILFYREVMIAYVKFGIEGIFKKLLLFKFLEFFQIKLKILLE